MVQGGVVPVFTFALVAGERSDIPTYTFYLHIYI
jgi:hypothetical protein